MAGLSGSQWLGLAFLVVALASLATGVTLLSRVTRRPAPPAVADSEHQPPAPPSEAEGGVDSAAHGAGPEESRPGP
ncbi:MAG: hypothetical protein ACYDDF_00435 [Thermoplasmatota archaeon]